VSGPRRLLAGLGEGPLQDALGGPALIDRVIRSGLRGRGGGGFPTGRKLEAVARHRRPVVVANGCEGEPESAKDALLLARRPHLLIDGAVLAAGAVGAREALVCVSAANAAGAAAVRAALGERRDRVAVHLHAVPERYVASEESALARHLDGGPALPASGPRPYARGLLVQNVETLAHVALVARHGSRWFRELGTPGDPGSALVTVGGAVRRPGVFEIALGTPLPDLLVAAGPEDRVRAVLLGGYGGTWVPGDARLALTRHGASAALGAGVVCVLPERACGICETAAVLDYLAGESARQCGPCTFGLRAIAGRLTQLSHGRAPARTLGQLRRWAADVEGRGACRHPDGAVRLLRSALVTFAEEADRHERGECGHGSTVLRVPATRREAA